MFFVGHKILELCLNIHSIYLDMYDHANRIILNVIFMNIQKPELPWHTLLFSGGWTPEQFWVLQPRSFFHCIVFWLLKPSQ